MGTGGRIISWVPKGFEGDYSSEKGENNREVRREEFGFGEVEF